MLIDAVHPETRRRTIELAKAFVPPEVWPQLPVLLWLVDNSLVDDTAARLLADHPDLDLP